MTDIFRYLLSLPTSVLHGSRAEASLQQSPREERKGTSHKDTTSREETATSTSHLGLQCNDNIGALQHHHHHYDWCTSYNLEDNIKKDEEKQTKKKNTSWMESATCSASHSHVYQHLQSSMVQHLHSHSGLVNFKHTSTSVSLSISTSWTSPTMRSNLLQPTLRCSKHQ